MNKIKCVAIERSNLNNLAKSIEEFQNKHNLISKGSIPFSLSTGNVGVIMFFNDSLELEEKEDLEETHPPSNSKSSFIISEKTLEKWKTQEPTKSQINILLKKGYSNEEANALSKYQAHKLISKEIK